MHPTTTENGDEKSPSSIITEAVIAAVHLNLQLSRKYRAVSQN